MLSDADELTSRPVGRNARSYWAVVARRRYMRHGVGRGEAKAAAVMA